MTTDVEPRLRELFGQLADQTNVSPDAEPVQHRAPRQRRPWSYSLAAAATVALVAGAIVVNVSRDTTSGNSVDGEPVGLFPAGDAERVVAFGFAGPADVAIAYLTDRLADFGDVADVTVSMWRPTLIEQDQTVVQFHLWEGDSQGTSGEVLVERVTNRGGATGWAVTAAMLRSGDLERVSFVDGTIEGDFGSGGEGSRFVTVHDAVSGELLATQELDGTREEGTDQWGDTKLIDEFRLTGIEESFVSVRAWNPSDSSSTGLPGEYAEVLIASGQTRVEGLETTFHEMTVEPFAGPFDGDEASVLDRLQVGEPLTVFDNEDVTIQLEAVGRNQFCINIAMGTPAQRANPGCWMQMATSDPPLVALMTNPNVDGDGRAVTVGMVPDSVATVTDVTGRPLPLSENVFYDIGPNTQRTYVISSADGSESQVLREGWLTVRIGESESSPARFEDSLN